MLKGGGSFQREPRNLTFQVCAQTATERILHITQKLGMTHFKNPRQRGNLNLPLY